MGGYMFEGNLDLDHKPVYGMKFGYDFTKYVGAELVLGIVRTHFTEPVQEVKTYVYNGRIEGLFYLLPDHKLVPYLAVGMGAQQTDYRRDIKDKWRFVGDYGVGLKYFVSDSFALRADVRHVLASGSVYNNLEYTFGLSFLFGGAKPAPMAVAQPEAAPAVVAPAPEPLAAPLGLAATAKSVSENDLEWSCVKDATGYKVYRDGAFAYDSKDCFAADKGLNADTTYCYKVSATDDKGRESVLSNESCAKTKPLPPPPVQEVKKPAESAAAAAVAKEIIEKGRATIDIKFDFDKAVVKPKYHDELGKFAEVLKNHPEINLVIEGHTDSVGKDDYNLKLSQKRADAVRTYIIEKFGIDANRLTAKGYGETRPVYDNRVKIGRDKNRRVEAAANYIIKK